MQVSAPNDDRAGIQRGADEAIRALTPVEIASPGFSSLLRLAAELEQSALDRIVTEEMLRLTTLGVVAGDRILAFASFDESRDPVPIEYIAVHERAQGRGLGAALVAAVRRRSPARAVSAQTDDDAVGFYRRLGFDIGSGAPDPRWPERARYDCLLSRAPETVTGAAASDQ